MNNRFCRLLILISCICAVSHSLDAQTAQSSKPTPEPGNPKEFIYVLRLVPRLYDDKNWTKEDNAALHQHFIRFQEAIKSGQLILAGRTKEPGDKAFGLAIFTASDEAAARKFMESDPAVVGKLMTAELHPFFIALQRKTPWSSRCMVNVGLLTKAIAKVSSSRPGYVKSRSKEVKRK